MQKEILARNIAIGAAGGLLATWVMTASQSRMKKLGNQLLPERKQQESGGNEDPATVKLAEKVSHTFSDRELSESTKQKAGNFVHWAFGTFVGAVFGGLLNLAPRNRLAAGLSYGLAVWMLADNLVVPALGLSKPPTKLPLKKNLYGLGSHLIYGASIGAAAKASEKALERLSRAA